MYIGLKADSVGYLWIYSDDYVDFDNFQTQPTADEIANNPAVTLYGGYWVVNPGTEAYPYICQDGLVLDV